MSERFSALRTWRNYASRARSICQHIAACGSAFIVTRASSPVAGKHGPTGQLLLTFRPTLAELARISRPRHLFWHICERLWQMRRTVVLLPQGHSADLTKRTFPLGNPQAEMTLAKDSCTPNFCGARPGSSPEQWEGKRGVVQGSHLG